MQFTVNRGMERVYIQLLDVCFPPGLVFIDANMILPIPSPTQCPVKGHNLTEAKNTGSYAVIGLCPKCSDESILQEIAKS